MYRRFLRVTMWASRNQLGSSPYPLRTKYQVPSTALLYIFIVQISIRSNQPIAALPQHHQQHQQHQQQCTELIAVRDNSCCALHSCAPDTCAGTVGNKKMTLTIKCQMSTHPTGGRMAWENEGPDQARTCAHESQPTVACMIEKQQEKNGSSYVQQR